MITKIKVEFNKSQEEVIDFLKCTEVSISRRIGHYGSQFNGKWKGLQNPQRFYLDFGVPILGGVNRSSLSTSTSNSNTRLSVWVINKGLLFFSLVAIGFTSFSVVRFGQHNYGTIGYWPSILLPSIAVLFMLFLWWLMSYMAALKIKKAILKSYKNYMLKMEG